MTRVLTAALCLLAIHKHEQDIVLKEIQSVKSDIPDEKLEFQHYEALTKTKAVFAEALRMYPAGTIMIREADEDTTLQVPCGVDVNGKLVEECTPISKGTWVIGDIVGMRKYTLLNAAQLDDPPRSVCKCRIQSTPLSPAGNFSTVEVVWDHHRRGVHCVLSRFQALYWQTVRSG